MNNDLALCTVLPTDPYPYCVVRSCDCDISRSGNRKPANVLVIAANQHLAPLYIGSYIAIVAYLRQVGLFVGHGHRLERVGLRQRHPRTCIGVHTQSDGSQRWLDFEHAMRTSPSTQRKLLAPISQQIWWDGHESIDVSTTTA